MPSAHQIAPGIFLHFLLTIPQIYPMYNGVESSAVFWFLSPPLDLPQVEVYVTEIHERLTCISLKENEDNYFLCSLKALIFQPYWKTLCGISMASKSRITLNSVFENSNYLLN